MSKREKIEMGIIYVVFGFYIAFLLKLLFFSRVSISELFDGQRTIERAVNLVPFSSIKNYLFSDSATIQRFAYSNVVGNIIAFVPLGAYLALFRKQKKILGSLLWVFAASVSVELIQGFFGIGTADIDDVILNFVGGLIGVLGYQLLLVILRNERRARTAIAIFSAMGLPVLFYYLFMIKLRL